MLKFILSPTGWQRKSVIAIVVLGSCLVWSALGAFAGFWSCLWFCTNPAFTGADGEDNGFGALGILVGWMAGGAVAGIGLALTGWMLIWWRSKVCDHSILPIQTSNTASAGSTGL